MVIKKYEYGCIYSITSFNIEDDTEKLEFGTPVRVIESLDDYTIIVEDYKGKQWKINNTDISKEKIEKIPKHSLIYSLLDKIDDYSDEISIVSFIIGIAIILMVVISITFVSVSCRVSVVFIAIGIMFSMTRLVIEIISIPPNTACFGNKQNIEELKILLNNDKKKVRIGCTPEEMPQGEEYKDFYFSDNYVGNLSTIAYDYLKESGKPGECVPILDDKNIVRGLRVIIYEEDATLNYKCVKIKNNNGEEENE